MWQQRKIKRRLIMPNWER